VNPELTDPRTGGERWSRPLIQVRSTLRAAAVTVAITTAVTLATYGFSVFKGTSFGELSRDPTTVLNGPFYLGYYSNLGMLVWVAAATTALLGQYLLRRVGHLEPARLLLVASVITVAVMLDDLFLLHDAVYREMGIPQYAPFTAYGLAIAAFSWRFRYQLGTDLLLIVAAVSCLGISAVLDTLFHLQPPYLIEDGAKALGLALWALMIVRYTIAELTSTIDRERI
jgi:hypothetical protein